MPLGTVRAVAELFVDATFIVVLIAALVVIYRLGREK